MALVTASTYGHDVTRAVRPGDRGTTTTVRMSLLRAPRFPDPHTDQGVHRFRHALVPGASVGDAVREGYRIGLPERRVPGDADVEPLVAVDDEGVVVSAVKLADDRGGDLVVRLYESRGARADVRLTTGVDPVGAQLCDLLERPLADPGRHGAGDRRGAAASAAAVRAGHAPLRWSREGAVTPRGWRSSRR